MASNVFSNTSWPMQVVSKDCELLHTEGVLQVDDIRVGTHWGTSHSNSAVTEEAGSKGSVAVV